MAYKLQATVLLLNYEDEPQFAINRKYVVDSVPTAVNLWETLEKTIDNMLQSETGTNPVLGEDEESFVFG